MPKYQIMANSTHFLVKIHPTQVMKSAFVIVSGVGRKKWVEILVSHGEYCIVANSTVQS